MQSAGCHRCPSLAQAVRGMWGVNDKVAVSATQESCWKAAAMHWQPRGSLSQPNRCLGCYSRLHVKAEAGCISATCIATTYSAAVLLSSGPSGCLCPHFLVLLCR